MSGDQRVQHQRGQDERGQDERGQDERGEFVPFVALFVVAVMVLLGLAVDGGYLLAARRRAIDEADGAARAGAQALAVPTYRSAGVVELDPAAAEEAAQGFLGATGHDGRVDVVDDRVVVSVSFAQPMALLRIVGVDEMGVSGRGEAHAVRGVESEE